jgi:outer membrane protein TolC
VVLCSTAAHRADAEMLSRAQAVARVLEANPEVQKGRADVSLFEGRVREAKADALPELTLLGYGLRYRDPALLNSSSFDAFPLELRDRLRPVPAGLYDGAASLRQTLFSFKLGSAVRAARLAADFGDEELRRTRQSVALQAVRAYNDYLLALERVRVAESASRQKEKHVEMASVRRAAGVATELDVLRSRVDLENQKAQLLRLRGQADLARSRLNAVMVRDVEAPIEPTDSLEYVAYEPSLEEATRAALADRPERRSAVLGERIRDELVGVSRGENRPRLELNAAWGYSVREPQNFLRSDFTKWSAGITLTVPIFDGFRAAGRVAQARAERAKAEQDRIAVENGIRLEAKEAVDRLRVARGVLSAADLNVTQARTALEMTEANYRHGAATTLDVLDAQAALTLAESLRVEALYEHADARATARYVMALDPLEGAGNP